LKSTKVYNHNIKQTMLLIDIPSGIHIEHIYPYLNGKCAQQFYRTCKTEIPSHMVIDAYVREWNKLSILKRVSWILKTQHRWNIHIISSLNEPITNQITFAGCKKSLPSGEQVYINGLERIKIWITVYDALGVILNESGAESFVNTIHLNVYRQYYTGSSIIRTVIPGLKKVVFQLHSF